MSLDKEKKGGHSLAGLKDPVGKNLVGTLQKWGRFFTLVVDSNLKPKKKPTATNKVVWLSQKKGSTKQPKFQGKDQRKSNRNKEIKKQTPCRVCGQKEKRVGTGQKATTKEGKGQIRGTRLRGVCQKSITKTER